MQHKLQLQRTSSRESFPCCVQLCVRLLLDQRAGAAEKLAHGPARVSGSPIDVSKTRLRQHWSNGNDETRGSLTELHYFQQKRGTKLPIFLSDPRDVSRS